LFDLKRLLVDLRLSGYWLFDCLAALAVTEPILRSKMAAVQAGMNGGGAETEKVNTHIVTLTRFLTEEQVKHKEATGDFT
jgi:hypothetical protein